MKLFKKIMYFLTFFLFCFGLIAGCAKQEDRFTLTIGMEAAYPPFNWTDDSKNDDNVQIKGKNNEFANGYDIRVAKFIAEDNDWNLEVVAMSWDSLIPSLQSGTINAIAAGMSVTEKRKESIDFSDPYYDSKLYLVARKDDSRFNENENFDFENNLTGVKLVTQAGTFEDDIAKEWADNFGGKYISATQDYPASFEQVSNGLADVVICEYPVAKSTVSALSSLKMVPFDNTKLSETYTEQTKISIGLKKEAPSEMPNFKQKINASLAKISDNQRTEWMDKAILSQGEQTTTPSLGEQMSSLLSNYWVTFGYGVLNTLLLAIVGTGVGLLIGIFVGQVRNLKSGRKDGKIVRFFKWLGRGLAYIYVTFFRGTPMMVQAMILFSVTSIWTNLTISGGIGNVLNGYMACGMIVICINTGAYMTENVRSGMNGVDKGQSEAAQSLGLSSQRTLWGITLPQALRNSLPTIGNEFIVNIKDSSVLNVIGLTELYRSVSLATRTNYFTVAGYVIIAIIYLILTLIASVSLKLIENKMNIPDKVNWFGIRRSSIEYWKNMFSRLKNRKKEDVDVSTDIDDQLLNVEEVKKLQRGEGNHE